ncbi:LysE family translocator [Ramlibacter humi]|uniref:LysE family translocator n=1 Tax=Ramlibacter humi TaxID=2530451 RepID=A0A4Z0CBL6_9BURK|nr:LysE family transporter [Ramlibacter humi]TFZ08404.1 LysE family translocator [Ramlibacter humi]
MTLATYLIYLAAVTLLIVTPGPTMLMTVTNALNHGPVRALSSAAGALTASVGVMALSAAGMGAVLAASETAFMVLKVVGAAYLVYLGIRTFRSGGTLKLGARAVRGGSLYVQGLLVGASNPKAILFFSAFFPQFIDPAQPVLPQFTLLAATFVIGDFLMLVVAAFGVGRIAGWLKQTHVVRWINRVCGGLFTVMGGLLLLSRRNA